MSSPVDVVYLRNWNYEMACYLRQFRFGFPAVGIRYGKYCGVGWTGCPGEEPCDELDACCKVHDECVEKKGT